MTTLTVSYPDFVRKLFNRSDDPSKDFTHAILGIKTEIHEYLHATDRINAIEELGDLAFYVEAMRQVINDYLVEGGYDTIHELDIEREMKTDLAILATFEPRTAKFEELSTLLNDLLDDAKRWVGYGREPDSLPAVFLSAAGAAAFAQSLGILSETPTEPDHIKAVNMAKLLKRYPGGDYDQFRALQRDLDGERETLEAAALG
jgi:hypothetical protein